TYDQFGNLTKTANPGITWQPGYTSNTNQYVTPTNCLTAGGTPCYEANGNLIRDTFNSYTWDIYGKMSSVRNGNSAAVCGSSGTCLTYDASGNMVEKNVAGVYTEILYSPIGKTAVMSGQTTSTALFPLPAGESVYEVGSNGGAKYFQHKDWQGTARFASAVANRTFYYDLAYAPFGEAYDKFGTNAGNIFAGLTGDTISGMFDTPNRELYPNQGRWISPDPAGIAAVDFTNPQTWNRYAYVANNPLGSTDPSGLDGGDLCGGAFDWASGAGFECESHDVPLAPWEMRPAFTEFSVPMGIFSGEDCLGCWPLGPDPMQILAQVISGNLAGALQGVGAIPADAIDCTSGTCQVNPLMDATAANTATISAYHPSVSTCLGQAAISAGEDLLGLSMLPGSDQDNWQWQSAGWNSGFVYTGAGEVMDSSVGLDAVENAADFVADTPAAQGTIRQFLRSQGVKWSTKHVAKDAAWAGKWAGRIGGALAAYNAYQRYQECGGD
ncbi:MAG TPA: RHS repeat-associated core domain-containing protein, partial [Candidatus Sulfotelmatobacter sp.]